MFKNNLPDLTWMDDQTRAAAIDKVGVYKLFGVRLYVCQRHLPATVNRKLS